MRLFFTQLFVSERKQIAMIADEKSPTRISHRIFATSRSEKEIIMQKVISTKRAPGAIGPYSQAIEINNMVFTSGVIPVNPATGEIAEGVEAQAEQAFENLCHLVEDSGSKVENIVKTTVFIKEMNDFGKINEIYKKYFKEPFPARSCVEVARLPKDVLLEVEAIAWK